MMDKQLKNVLLEKINDEKVIYKIASYLKKYRQPKSYFEQKFYMELKLYLMQEYHKHQNLSSLFNEQKLVEILKAIPQDLPKEQFEKEIDKLTRIISQKNNLDLNVLLHRSFNSVIGLSGWFKIYANKIKGTAVSDSTHRIYLAVDNSSLHKFALLLVKYCEIYNVQYQFKINNADPENAYDNVVIYANEKELPIYIHCIEDILNKYPDIKMNQSCLLAHQYNKNISIAPYIDTGASSYSDIVSNEIAEYRYTANNRNEFLSYVEKYLEETLAETKALCDKIKLDNTYNHHKKR